MQQPMTEAEIAAVFQRYADGEMTKMQACAALGISHGPFEELMRQRGLVSTGVRPTVFMSREREVISEQDRAKAELAWSAAMQGRRFDQYRVSPDPRRLVAPGTFVPTTSPLVSR